MIATQVYRFVAPGLYSHERNAFRPYLIATPVFFILGAALVYFILLPVAIKFFYALAAATGGEGEPAVELMPDVIDGRRQVLLRVDQRTVEIEDENGPHRGIIAS